MDNERVGTGLFKPKSPAANDGTPASETYHRDICVANSSKMLATLE